MSLKGFLGRLSPVLLRSGLAILGALPLARRLLRKQQPAPTVLHPEMPYDPLELMRLRRCARAVRKLPGNHKGGAAAGVAAAAVVAARKGWPCELWVHEHAGSTRAELRLWGVRVLGTQSEPLQEAQCLLAAGPPIPSMTPRLPSIHDATVARSRCEGNVEETLRELLGQLGGLERFVQGGESVLLKPNFNSHHLPPASTALDLLEAMVRLLREAGASRVSVGESSGIYFPRTRPVLARAGLTQWAKTAGVEVIAFDEEPWRQCPIIGDHFKYIVLPEALQRFDRLIYLAPVKTHRQAGVSLSQKLAVGLMHPAQRLELHNGDLVERVADIRLAVRPDLAILDGRCCFVTGGPETGEVRHPGMLLASADVVTLDAAGIRLLTAHGAQGLEK